MENLIFCAVVHPRTADFFVALLSLPIGMVKTRIALMIILLKIENLNRQLQYT